MRKTKEAKIIEQYLSTMPEWIRIYSDLEGKIRRRCLLEGCVFGYELIDKEPKDNCIYCGEPRNYVFGIPEIRKSLKKRGIKKL
ncbi:MAG: hypothetical protein M0P59_13480 [Gallionella sp.]|jgi:hypothetical protein|nr:hypothetical protein [Gallionella sp.]